MRHLFLILALVVSYSMAILCDSGFAESHKHIIYLTLILGTIISIVLLINWLRLLYDAYWSYFVKMVKKEDEILRNQYKKYNKEINKLVKTLDKEGF